MEQGGQDASNIVPIDSKGRLVLTTSRLSLCIALLLPHFLLGVPAALFVVVAYFV